MTLKVKSWGTSGGWPWRIKCARVLWAFFSPLFLRGTTRYLSPLRIRALRLFGARLDSHVLVSDGVKIWYPWNLEMAYGSCLGVGVEVYNFAPVRIGEQATVSQYAYLCAATHDYTDSTMPLVSRPIDIGPGAWIAARSFVGPGVVVGEGAVVGACAVVTGNVDPWSVVAGNPARHIKRRELLR